MGSDETKNLILAAVLSMIVVFGWYTLFPPAPPPVEQPAAEQQAEGQVPVPGAEVPTQPAAIAQSREEALKGDRIEIESPALSGSLRLTGGRIDDLHLSNYRVSLDTESDTVVLLNPVGAPAPYYIDFGWVRTEGSDPGPLPGDDTPWQLESGSRLTPETPVTLVWNNGQGLIFRRKIALDDAYMFAISQSAVSAMIMNDAPDVWLSPLPVL